MPMIDNFKGLVMAAPPSARPSATKRRPHPRSVTRAPSCATKYAAEGSTAEAESKEELEVGNAEEVSRLHRVIGDLTRRCDSQSQELVELRSRIQDLEGQAAQPARQAESAARAPQRIPTATQMTQTEESGEPALAAKSHASEAAESREEQREQLEAIHREAGEKGRELRKAQESVRLLRRELEEQRLVAEQYRTQVDVLEEQLQMAMQKRLRSTAPSSSSASITTRSPGQGRFGADPHRGELTHCRAASAAEASDEDSSDDCATARTRR